MRSSPRRSVLLPLIFVVCMLLLSYLLATAVMYLKLTTSEFLHDAFIGAQAWSERRDAFTSRTTTEYPISQDVDQAEKTFDGFTLYTTNVGARALLINMHGEIVHEWAAPFSRVWPTPAHVREP